MALGETLVITIGFTTGNKLFFKIIYMFRTAGPFSRVQSYTFTVLLCTLENGLAVGNIFNILFFIFF